MTNSSTKTEEKTGIEKARAVRDQLAASSKQNEKKLDLAVGVSEINPNQTTFNGFVIRKAQRSNAKLRVGLAGPSGSGKTYSALLLAHGMAAWEDIAIIDTENGSADLYSQLGPYNVLTLEKPFHPNRYIEAIHAAEQAGMKVIIIDSITHEWSGQGGCLEIQEKLGGRFQDWGKVTPLHNRFVQTILQAKAHVITTVRSKTDYSMSQEGGGKSKVQKVGMKPETREGFEYEMTVSFDININNMADVSKDRTGLFKSKAPLVIDEGVGDELLKWSDSGMDYVARIEELLTKKGKTVDPILTTFKVFSLAELTTGQFKKTIAKLETLPDAAPESKKEKEEKVDEGNQEKTKEESSE